MHWKVWRCLEVTLDLIAFVLVLPGAYLLDVADWCQRKKQEAKSKLVRPIKDPTFIKSERVE